MNIENSKKYLDDIKSELTNMVVEMYNNPELGEEEYNSAKLHVDILSKNDFEVEAPYLGIETAFKAVYDSKKPGPTIAYLSEYDALPSIGHGCGHNILGAVSTGSGILLSKFIDEIGGKVIVLGTPAEESNGAKVTMAEKGIFKDIDVAMLSHPSDNYYKSCESMALRSLEVDYHGITAHAAACPEKGVNSLDAVIQLFNSVNALRQQILATSRVHGIISDGGKRPNIIPDFAQARFYVRSKKKDYNDLLFEKIINCAKGAALATGTKLEFREYEYRNDDMITNNALHNSYIKNIEKVLGKKLPDVVRNPGSTDMGNVSHVCPAIHPYFDITNGKSIHGHTTEFADCSVSDYGIEQMCNSILGLALTGYDIIVDKELLSSIKKEFNSKK